MSLTGVGPRASKEEFMRALRLDPINNAHESYYREMREKAIHVYHQLNADRSNLIEEKRNDHNVQPSFFWHHIRVDRRKEAILRTWYSAEPNSRTRMLFDMGATQNNDIGPNWVTHWLLYSVFRSRDERNNRNRKTGDDKGHAGSGGSGKICMTDLP
ncbi:MAG: hypothetical protein Q9227_000867 [Pyrenula ochraceoflavens]